MIQNTETLLYDRYSVVHIERNNSFSQVLFALDTYQNPPRNCVIKIFQPIVDKSEVVQWIDKKFALEAKRLKQISLNNPYIPEIYTYSSSFQACYIVRELIEGKTLQEKVLTTGKFSAAKVKKILTQLLFVLDYVHSQGVIHQNIKPKNIVLRHEDLVPMLINFGSIKQIAATYAFSEDRQIFSASNIHGYAPLEQALCKPVAATDLYSLGLTAVYLLTGKKPVDLPTKSNSSNFQIPPIIASLDLQLARVLARAINPDIKDRYSSAQEMLKDLSQDVLPNISLASYQKSVPKAYHQAYSHNLRSIAPVKTNKNRLQGSSWWKIMIYLTVCTYVAGTALVIWYDWSLSQNTFVPELPQPSTLPPISPLEDTSEKTIKQPAAKQPTKQPSILNSQSPNLTEIPIVPVGTSKEQLRKALGEPNAIQQGYWENSSAWIYKNWANNSIDMGYLFDLDTDRLRQTEVAIAPSVGLETMNDILNSLLQGKITPSISQALASVYQRKTDKHLLSLENLELSIEREEDGHVYLGVWESDFH